MGARRAAPRRRRPSSSSGVRHALGAVCLVVVLVFLGQVAYSLAQEERWASAAVAGFVMAGLLLVVWISMRQGPVFLVRSGKATKKRRRG
jgi:protein-S-isoprenylcysteine O-methyltransferase Ste14